MHSFIAIDEEFLRGHSQQPDVVLAYNRDARKWTEAYLKSHGIGILVPYFDPKGSKLVRATRFIENYREFLTDSGLIEDLRTLVESSYHTSLKEIVGGN